nr:4Fe-4S binding protein [Serratia fonticola]
MTLNHNRCTGCGSCEDSCLAHAIKITGSHQSTLTTLKVSEVHCSSCQRLFFAWREQSDKCPVCQRHRYGMREA